MKKLAIIALGAVAASAATIEPMFAEKAFQDKAINQNLAAFIEKLQSLTVLPVKEGITLKTYEMIGSEKVLGANKHNLNFKVTLEDQDKATYSGKLTLVYSLDDEKYAIETAEITYWDGSLSTNLDIPIKVEIQSPFLLSDRNITKEIYGQQALTKMNDFAKASKQIKNLKKIYPDIHLVQSRMKHVVIQNLVPFDSGNVLTETLFTFEGTNNGKTHTWDLFIDNFDTTFRNFPHKNDYVVRPHDKEELCNLLINLAQTQGPKHLQEKNLVPAGDFTVKEGSCKHIPIEYALYETKRRDKTERIDMKVAVTLEDANKINYKLDLLQNFQQDTGVFSLYGTYEGVKNLTWDTKAAHIQGNPLFPTEYFKPLLSCSYNSIVEDDQKAVAFNQEIPVKLFDFILTKQTKDFPKELVGKKYTTSDIKVHTIDTSCESTHINYIYTMSGVITTTDGLKFKAELKGSNAMRGWNWITIEEKPKDFKGKLWSKLAGPKTHSEKKYNAMGEGFEVMSAKFTPLQ